MKKEIKSVPQEKIKNPTLRFCVLGVATGGGLGYSPIAPGTMGSLLGIPLGLYMLQFPGWLALLILTALTLLMSPLCERCNRHWGVADSGKIVIDEVVGQAITMIGLRHFVRTQEILPSFGFILTAFILFRLLDILKPFPARVFDRQKSGFSVMADDYIAGLYGAMLLYAVVKVIKGI